jgi:hypothetical protein
VGVGVVAGLLSIGSVVWFRLSDEIHGERAIAWLVAGALMSLVPLGGTMATGRLTTAPALGFDALLAFLLCRTSTAVLNPARSWSRIIAIALAALCFGVALAVPVRRSHDGANYMNGMTNLERGWIEHADFGVASLAGRNVFVLSARDLASEISIPYILHAAGRAMPESAALLSPRGDGPQTLVRVADNAFELAVATPTLPPTRFNGSVYRATGELMNSGQKFRSTCFEVTVVETKSGEPSILRFDFSTPLENDALVFVVAAKGQMRRFYMPRIGDRVIIAPAEGP